MLELQDRLLFEDGSSLVTQDFACLHLVKTGNLTGIRVFDSTDTRLYEHYYGEEATFKEGDYSIHKSSTQHCEGRDRILKAVQLPRDNTALDDHQKRVALEMDYFVRIDKLDFIHALIKLVDKLRAKQIPWGGRGSSCASYILYLIGVHDTNPIQFDIPFSEFSKEREEYSGNNHNKKSPLV